MTNHSLDRKKIKILLLEGVHQNAVDNFKANGYTDIECHPKALPEEILIEKIADAHIIGIRSRTKITENILEHANKLISIGCFCIGTNQVDLEAAKRQGVAVFNAPFSNTRSVAELVLAEAIMLMRGIPEKNASAHEGGWSKSAKDSYEVRGKKLGIVGYGHIGTQVGVLAEALGMKVYYHDIVAKLSLGNAKPVETLRELLNISDVVTLHVPATPETKEMIGQKELDQMKPGSHLINASRGNVIQIYPLCEALKSKHLLGAAIDVFPAEPKSKEEEFISPLREFQNVILTPHIGGSTLEAQSNIGTEVSEKLITYSDNGSTLSAVNFVEVSLPKHEGCHRLLHIHKNIPGMMAEINKVFSEANINIESQYLQTDPKLGYVVTDVSNANTKEVLEKLKNIPGTIRARILY